MMKHSLNTPPLAISQQSHLYKIPLLGEYGVHAFAKGTMDVNTFLVGSSGATSFVFTVVTTDFFNDGIKRGDNLLVDTDLEALPGDLVIAAIGNAYCLLRWSDDPGVNVWAVVTGVIRKLRANGG